MNFSCHDFISLFCQAVQANISLQTLIVQTLRQLVQAWPDSTSQWPDVVLSYEGSPDFPAFESYRDELLQSDEPGLSHIAANVELG